MKESLYKRMFKLIVQHWPYLLLSTVAALIYVALNSASIWLTASLINNILMDFDKLISDQARLAGQEILSLNEKLKFWTNGFILRDTPQETLKVLCLSIVAIFLTKNIFLYLKNILMALVQFQLITDLRNRLYEHFNSLSLSYFNQKKSGELTSIIINDVANLQRSISTTFNKLLIEPINILVFTILLFGLTGVLGKLISVDAYLLVWYRLGIALFGLLFYFGITKFSLKISKKQLVKLLLVGVVIAAHWVTFFTAIKLSNVSVALVCFSTSTLFTSLLEPLYFKRKIKAYELMFGIIIILGLYFIFSFEFKYVIGMTLSVVSAALASWFTVLNGVLVKENKAKIISFYELLGAFIVVSVYLLISFKAEINQFAIPITDVKWLIILGIVCTAFAFIVSVEVMKKISPYTVTMSVNLEPIYSILLALLIWPESEIMSYGFYMGTIIVIATIFLNAFLKNKLSKEKRVLL